MHRRRFLTSAGLAFMAGSGCLSQENSPGTEPLSGTFDSIPTDSYWHLSVETDTALDSHPALAVHDDIYVAPGSRLSRISPDGTKQWTVKTRTGLGTLEATDSGLIYSGGAGLESSPILGAHSSEDGTEVWWEEPEYDPRLVGATSNAVYSGARTNDPASRDMPVTAYDVDSGEQRWRVATGTTLDGVVTHDLCLIESYPATLVAFTTASGDEQWRKSFDDEINGLHVIESTLVLLTQGGISTCSLPSGSLRWTKSIGDQEWLATDGGESESPETIFVGGRDGTLRAIDLSSGEVQWSKTPPAENDQERIIGVTQGNNRVVLRKGNTLLGLNAAGGRERWRQILSPLYDVSAPVVIGERVFLLHSPEGEKIQVKTFDSTTGERQWRYSAELPDNLLPPYSVTDDRLIMAMQYGDVYGFGTTGE